MAILKNVEIWFPKLDPKRPAKVFNPENPTWEVQIRTTNKAQKIEWEQHHIKVKAVREDPSDEESKILYYKAGLKKKSLKEGKVKGVFDEPSVPVELVDGRGNPVDPNTVGNGSIANIRIFEKDYVYQGKEGISAMLVGIQLIKHVVWVGKPMEEFEDVFDTETVMPEATPTTEEDDGKVF
jgi:hypothetical protein